MEVDDYQVVNRKMRLDILDVGHVIYSEDCQMAFLIPAKKMKEKKPCMGYIYVFEASDVHILVWRHFTLSVWLPER